MNDEIKEILEHIQYVIDEDDYWEVTKVTLKPLLDYITNLQEEIEKLNEDKRGMLVQLYKANNNRDKAKQENERLKETNVYCNRTDCVGRIKDSRKYDSVYQEKEDYKSRCDKAIEDIKFCLHSIKQEYEMSTDERTRNEMESCVQIFNKTLNTLQNGSENK